MRNEQEKEQDGSKQGGRATMHARSQANNETKERREREVFYKRYAPPAPAGTSVAEVTSMRSPPTSPPAEGSRRAEHLCR